MKEMISKEELNRRINQPLDNKIFHFVSVFVEYFLFYNGEVYLSWSAGKDSDVGCDIIDRIWSGEFTGKFITPDTWQLVTSYPKPKRVFCNTGLEFPEIVDRAKERAALFGDVVIMKPLMGFPRVIKEVGVAIGSKKIAMMVERVKGYLANPSHKNENTKRLYLTGIKRDGSYSAKSKIPDRWLKLLDAPFPTSSKCCDIFKKEPFDRYEKQTGQKPVCFTTTQESDTRLVSYLKTGCNSFSKGKEMCRPYSIFTDSDTWEYARRYGITFCSVYYDREVNVEQLDGSIKKECLPAEKRTGCTYCFFGIHLEPKGQNNRIQRLAISHPKYYDIIVNKCGLSSIFEYIGVPYKPYKKYVQQDLFPKDA